jgi:hypothetical protein
MADSSTKEFTIGSKDAGDKLTEYTFNADQIFLGLVTYQRTFEFSQKKRGIEELLKVNIVAYFGVVTINGRCFCPGTPKNFKVEQDYLEEGSDKRTVIVTWSPWDGEGYKPSEYILKQGTASGIDITYQKSYTLKDSVYKYTFTDLKYDLDLGFSLQANTQTCKGYEVFTDTSAHNLCLRQVVHQSNPFFSSLKSTSDYQYLAILWDKYMQGSFDQIWLNKVYSTLDSGAFSGVQLPEADHFFASAELQNHFGDGENDLKSMAVHGYYPPIRTIEDRVGKSLELGPGDHISRFKFWTGR